MASVLVLGDTIYSANLGDSKAILCRRSTGTSSEEKKLSFIHLTKDHNPSNVSLLIHMYFLHGSYKTA